MYGTNSKMVRVFVLMISALVFIYSIVVNYKNYATN